jgi:hypothetical protein
MLQKIFGLKKYLIINFQADQQSGMSQDAAALFAQKANQEDGDGGGKHGILKMHESLEKILLPLGAMNQAAKTFEGMEKSSIQGALSPLTAPLPGIINIGTTHLNILGVNLLGEKKHLDMNASAQDIVGEIQSLTGDAGGSEDSGGGGDDYHGQSQHGDMFDMSSEDYNSSVSAAHDILSGGGGGESYDHSPSLAGLSGAEHRESISDFVAPSDSPPVQVSQGGRTFHDD